MDKRIAVMYEQVRSAQCKFLLRMARQEFASRLNEALLDEYPDMDFDADWCSSSPSSMLGRVDDLMQKSAVVRAMGKSRSFRLRVRKAKNEFGSKIDEAFHKLLK